MRRDDDHRAFPPVCRHSSYIKIRECPAFTGRRLLYDEINFNPRLALTCAAADSREDSKLLTIEMTGSSEADLEKIVADRCARYGRVASVRVVLPAGPARFAVALVRMSTAGALDDVIASIGGTKSHSTAIIRLDRQEPGAALSV